MTLAGGLVDRRVMPIFNLEKDMGFSLEHFLQELTDIINSNNMDAGEKLQDLLIRVQDAKEYAKQCGLLG